MERKLYESKIQSGLEETSRIREELRQLMSGETKFEQIRNHFILRGIDTTKVDIILNQVFKDREEREKLRLAAKKRTSLSILFLFLFAAGVTGWFYIWGDWITYFTGINLVLFLFFLQQAFSLKGKAKIYE
jgi:hypothetical protein